MSRTDNHAVSSKSLGPVQIDSIEELEAWLDSKGIDTSRWGRGAAKTVEALYEEIVSGESHLEDDPPRRVVSLVQVLIRRGDLTLIETEQEFSDGRRRTRNRPLGEKLRPPESYRQAVLRGIEEELDVPSERVHVLESTYRTEQTELESPSYPGLHSCYNMHILGVEIEGLPEGDFVTYEKSDGHAELVGKHHWSWQRYVG
jgi:hypothetical protein